MNSPGINLKYPFALQPNVIEGQFGKPGIRALIPARSAGHVTPQLDEKLSRASLAIVLIAHMAIFMVLVNAAPIKPQIKPLAKPMLVSLVAVPAPKPEVAPLLPTPPKPEPVVKKQKPKPIVKEVTPEPQPIAAEQPVVAEPPPAAITPAPPAVVSKAPEPPKEVPVVEPKIEPPRFGAAYLENPAPAYPSQSRRIGEEGRVLLRVLVSEKGDASNVEIDSGSGSERLDQAALNAVKKWRFIPAKRNNQPISAYVIVPIKFSLQS
jgi:periplasmic protein TonB